MMCGPPSHKAKSQVERGVEEIITKTSFLHKRKYWVATDSQIWGKKQIEPRINPEFKWAWPLISQETAQEYRP